MLALQETAHWRLGDVEFARNFHYKLESGDSLLEAIVNVPKRFQEPYMWSWDDSVYPFTLNLVRPSGDVTGTVIAGKNLAGVSVEESSEEMFTRIYPMGAGEGDDKLDITSVNGGVPYLEDADAIERYGLISRVWEDNRYTNADSLKDDAQARLDRFKQPLKTVEIRAIDYELVDPHELERYEIGSSVIVHDRDTGIDDVLEVEGIEKTDVYDSPQDIKLTFGNRRQELTDTVDVIEKDLTQTQKDAVYKGRVYNGTSITPEDGFVATRSDNTARTILNATDGFKVQKGDGTGSQWDDVVYVDTAGNARFTGRIDASQIFGGLINGAQIIADTTIDVGTDIRVGNYVRVGSVGSVNKGIIFSDLAEISYQNHGLQLSGASVSMIGTGSSAFVYISSGDSVNISGNGRVNIEGSEVRLNGISFGYIGSGLQVYYNGSPVGTIEFSGVG